MEALRAWGIDAARIERNLGGSGMASWLVSSADGRFVLRRIAGDRDYLDYQIAVLANLSRSAFSIAVPKLLETRTGSTSHHDDDAAWILYRYLPGQPPKAFAPDRASELGAIVGSFDQATASLNLGQRTGDFALPLFQREDILATLAEAPAPHPILPAMLESYRAIPDSIVEAVSNLPRQTIYNDWHRWNLLEQGGRITGLVDFDSLVEAPRIVDYQNALGYLLMSQAEPRAGIIEAFSRGFSAYAPLAREESDLIGPVMTDRLLWLVADIAQEIRRNGHSGREGLMLRATRLLSWLVTSKPTLYRTQ
jgi:Ser/Thr protein kinase RdoA (MazF antagonist)